MKGNFIQGLEVRRVGKNEDKAQGIKMECLHLTEKMEEDNIYSALVGYYTL